ncbi:MAG: tryptophan-rich sensory protein [Gilvibacter sp.]
MNKDKFYALANAIAFIIVVYINYLSNTGAINGQTIGGVSDAYTTLFTPAGYAFAIWGLIYLLLLGFVIYGLAKAFGANTKNEFLQAIGPWFIISCAANIAWIYCWLYDLTAASLGCMFLILISLLVIVVKNRMELWDAPFKVILFLWWPFVIYSGWITVASVANVSTYLQKIEWSGWGLSATTWTIVMIVIAGLINLMVTWKRNMREFAAVGAWALIAIQVANKDSNTPVANTALAIATILIVSIAIHAFKNRKTLPFIGAFFKT